MDNQSRQPQIAGQLDGRLQDVLLKQFHPRIVWNDVFSRIRDWGFGFRLKNRQVRQTPIFHLRHLYEFHLNLRYAARSDKQIRMDLCARVFILHFGRLTSCKSNISFLLLDRNIPREKRAPSECLVERAGRCNNSDHHVLLPGNKQVMEVSLHGNLCA